MTVRLTLLPGESRVYTFDFHNQPEITNGDTILTVTSVTSTPAGLVFGIASVVDFTDPNTAIVYPLSAVNVEISSGTPNTKYYCKCTVNMASGTNLECVGFLTVAELT